MDWSSGWDWESDLELGTGLSWESDLGSGSGRDGESGSELGSRSHKASDWVYAMVWDRKT